MTTPHAPGARPTPASTESDAPAQVQSIFNSIAPTYDRLNHLLSFGLDRLWWRHTARTFRTTLQNPQARIVDLCCGTGDQTAALLALRPDPANPTTLASCHPERSEGSAFPHPGTSIPIAIEPLTGLDFSPQMLARAHTKFPAANVRWIEGDAMALPFADASIDLITAAFGFRNLPNYAAALAEFHRVLAPGGRLGILECNHPSGISGKLYEFYANYVLPRVGGLISGDRAAYDYLPASIARFPRPPAMKQLLIAAGFTNPQWQPHFMHVAGLYTATKP